MGEYNRKVGVGCTFVASTVEGKGLEPALYFVFTLYSDRPPWGAKFLLIASM